MEKLKEYEGKETAQLVDRYKFLDLYPCTTTELKSIGYTEHVNIKSTPGQPTQEQLDAAPTLPRPSFAQMIPYKPKANAYYGEHPLPGGTFPQPPALAALCARLPPPVSFRGPFVSIDKLVDIFSRIQLPDAPVTATETGLDVKLFDLAKSVHWIVDDSTSTNDSVKRRRIVPGGDDSDEEGQGTVPPPNDIYRLRQQKRMK